MSVVKSATASSYATIDSLLKRVRAKVANAEPDPGGHDGGSSHPSADADNSTITVSEGERSSENTSQVKEDVPASVDAAEEGVGDGKQDSVQLNIGTEQSATGDDPSSETSSVNDKLPDPGGYKGDTSHPANLDNPAVSEKYSFARNLQAKIVTVKEAGHQLLAKLAMSPATTPSATAGSPPTKSEPAPATGKPAENKAAAAGAAAADAAIQAKQAMDAELQQRVVDTLKYAEDNAAITFQYASGFFDQSRRLAGKKAGDDGGESEEKEDSDSGESSGGGESKPKSDDGGGGGPPPFGGDGGGGGGGGDASGGGPPMAVSSPAGAGGGGGGGDASALLSLLAQGDSMGAPSPAAMAGGGAAGGGDPLAAMAGGGGAPPAGGGDPLAALAGGGAGGGLPGAGGGMPGAGGPPGAGALGGDQAAMLAQILAELGIAPQALEGKVAVHIAKQINEPSKVPAKGAWAARNASEKEAYESMKQVVQEFCR